MKAYMALLWRLCLLFTGPLLSALAMARMINGSAEIAINAMRGFIGDEFTVQCSSMPVRPGTRLSIHWSTLEGSSTNPPILVGECHSVRAGFPGMECSPGVDIIEPYTDGVTDFAVSSIVRQVRVKPTRFRCQPGNGETLEVEPVLLLRPEIEDLYIVCHNEQTRLEWQHRGEAGHFEVDAGDGRWQTVSDNYFPFSSNFSTEQVLKVRAVNEHGAGLYKEINTDLGILYKNRHPIFGLSTPVNAHTSCSDEYFYVATNSTYRPLSFFIKVNSAISIKKTNQTLETVVDIPDNAGAELTITLAAFWDCESPEITGVSGCKDNDYCRIVSRYIRPYAFDVNLHSLHFGCAREENQVLYLNLEWQHMLAWQYYASSSIYNVYHGSYYEVAVTEGNNTRMYTKAVSLGNGFRSAYTQPQDFVLRAAYDACYHITITPIYPFFDRFFSSILHDSRCERQAITFNLEIPPETQIKQLSEESVAIVPGDISTGFSAIITSQNQTSGETEYQVAAGEQNLTLNGLEPELQYTVTVAYNGTEITPCRTEILNFSITLPPEPGTTVYPEPSSVISVQTSGIVQSDSPLATYSIPTEKPGITVYPGTTFPPETSAPAGGGQNNLSYIVYSVDGVVYLSLAVFLAATPCMFALARYYKKRQEE